MAFGTSKIASQRYQSPEELFPNYLIGKKHKSLLKVEKTNSLGITHLLILFSIVLEVTKQS